MLRFVVCYSICCLLCFQYIITRLTNTYWLPDLHPSDFCLKSATSVGEKSYTFYIGFEWSNSVSNISQDSGMVLKTGNCLPFAN